MTLKSLRDLDKDDLLRLIGLQTKRGAAEWILPSMAVFGLGLLVGAGVGVLLAPKPGRALRDDLRHRLQGLSEGMRESYSEQSGASSEARPAAS